MANFKLEKLQNLYFPMYAEKHKITSETSVKLRLVATAGDLAKAILEKNIQKQKECLGLCFGYASILGLIKEKKLVLTRKGNTYYGSDVGQKLGYFAKEQTLTVLFSIAENLNFDLKECANLAYERLCSPYKLIVKNPEYVRGND